MLESTDFVVSYLLQERLVTGEGVARAQALAAEKGTSLGEALVSSGVIGAVALAIARASVAECCFVDLAHYEIDVSNASLLPQGVAEKVGAFPLFRMGSMVVVGMADPLDLRGADRVRGALKADIEVVQCEPEALWGLIGRAYSIQGAGEVGRALVARSAESAPDDLSGDPIVSAVNQIIAHGVEQGASDIHINPDEKDLYLRYRIDGLLHRRQGPSLGSHPALVQRIKVMAALDLTQTRRPQDGKFRYTHHGKHVDVRVSLAPTVCGENVVLRLLAGELQLRDFSSLGFAPDTGQEFEELFGHGLGMILVSGPTGSGKTTTLYTGLQKVNTPDRNVVTIEDPVEIRLPMVRQIQVNSEIGLTFAAALRAILRQDPDVVLVGEIRDEETARIALQAALTGHLVLSTVHTNDAPSSVARLADFNCPVFAINTALLCVLAQRLVRRVCPHCSAPYQPEEALVRRFRGLHPGELRRGKGCPRCMSTGYHGRVAVYELMRMTPGLQDAVEAKASSAALRKLALRQGMKAMWQDGLEKARLGVTTLEEVAEIAAGTIDADLAALGAASTRSAA